MRRLTKDQEPDVLQQNRTAWATAFLANPSDYKLHKYRHPDIKSAIVKEAHSKCAYCESKIGHNTPGDTDHKLPVSERPELAFDWSNMILSCAECNRRKGSYYEPDCPLLDPHTDDVESLLSHEGPVVMPLPGNTRAEVTVRKLELGPAGGKSRTELFARKMETLEDVGHLLDRISRNAEPLRACLVQELEQRCSVEAEYSAMVRSCVRKLIALSQLGQLNI